MFKFTEPLEIINAFHGISNSYKTFTDRPSHAFIYKIDGESEYIFKDRKILLSQNEILFIPAGETYYVQKICEGESKYALVNFNAKLDNAAPEKYKIDNGPEMSFVFDKLVKACLFTKTSNYYMSRALFYQILALISQGEERQYYSLTQRDKLTPAIRYLEEHIFDCDLRIEQLHTFCGISDTYFRNIFISEFGVSPKQYIMNKRLAQAKNIFDNSNYMYVYEVAEAVGYTDALYFSRIFKRRYGYAPSASAPSE